MWHLASFDSHPASSPLPSPNGSSDDLCSLLLSLMRPTVWGCFSSSSSSPGAQPRFSALSSYYDFINSGHKITLSTVYRKNRDQQVLGGKNCSPTAYSLYLSRSGLTLHLCSSNMKLLRSKSSSTQRLPGQHPSNDSRKRAQMREIISTISSLYTLKPRNKMGKRKTEIHKALLEKHSLWGLA